MNRLAQAKQRHATIVAEMRALNDAATDGTFTAEQDTQYKALDTKRIAAAATLKREEDLAAHERTAPAVETQANNGSGRVTDVKLRADEDPRRGFKNHREFMLACIDNAEAQDREDISDERLRPLAQMGGDDGKRGEPGAYLLPRAFNPRFLATVGSDEQGEYDNRYGGFAVTPTFLPGMLSIGGEGDPTAGRTTNIPMASPTIELLARTDKNHTTSVSGGFTVARRAETAAISASRSEMEKVTLKAASLFGLAYSTEELLTDSPISFVAYIDAGFRDQFTHHMIGEKLFGLGAGQYTGAVVSDCKVAVTRDTASRILGTDLIAMRQRCWGYGQAIWIANLDCVGEIMRAGAASYDAAAATPLSGNNAIYTQSMQEGQPDRILGRPVFYTEYAETLGTVGDIILGNWSQYLEGLYQPLQSAESMHVRFLNHERAFKFWLRNAGAPWWRSALTPNQSSATLSPFVHLT